MITLRKRISRPLITLIIFVPLVILIFFNITISYFAKIEIEQELLFMAADATEKLSKADNSTTPFFKISGISSSSDIIVYNHLGEISKYSKLDDNSFVTETLAKQAYDISTNIPLGEIGSFKYEGRDYYIIELAIASKPLKNKAIYISQGYFLDNFIFIINLLLVLISACVIMIASFISTKVANYIARPIEYITKGVESINYDEILMLDTMDHTIEFQKLSYAINKMSRRIYDAHNSQKMFLNNASHELRTPLMSIRGYADGIEMGIFADTQSTAHIISEEVQKLTSLIDGLLTLGRIENFDDIDSLETINLENYLSELLHTYNGYALSKSIEIDYSIVENIYIKGNDELLRAIFGNILSNGLRYARTKIDIITKMYPANSTISILIKNDGEDITNQDKIFDRFSKGKNGNFGLGLSIAKTSISKLGGDIKAYNDNGAIFEVTIPIAKQ